MAIHRKILRWLETELFEGNIQLGQSLPDDQRIAHAIGVGRSRTRDALKTLEDMELMRLYSGRGKEIIPYLYEEPAAAAAGPIRLHMSTSRYPTRDMLQTRILLESWAVSNIDPDKVSFDEVDEALETLQDDTLSIGEFLDQLLTFHHRLVRLAGNELVVGLLVAIRQSSFDSLLSLMGRLPLWSSTMTRIRVENRAIVDAVKDGDARTARELIAHQLQELYSEAGIELDQAANTPNGMPGDPSEDDEEFQEEEYSEESTDSSEEPESDADVEEHKETEPEQDAGENIPESEYKAEQEKSPAAQLPKIIREGTTVSRRRQGRVRVPTPVAVGFEEDEAEETASAANTGDIPTADASEQQETVESTHEPPIDPLEETAAHEPQLESVQPEFEDDVLPVDEPGESASDDAQDKESAEEITTEKAPDKSADGSEKSKSLEEAQGKSQDGSASHEDSTESTEDKDDEETPDEQEHVREVYVEKAPVGKISAEELVATGLIPWRTMGQQAENGTSPQTEAEGEDDVIRAPLRRNVPPVRPAQFSPLKSEKPEKAEKPASERISLIRRVRHYFGLDLPHTQAVKLVEAQEAAEQKAADNAKFAAEPPKVEPKSASASSPEDAPAAASAEASKSSAAEQEREVSTEPKKPATEPSPAKAAEAPKPAEASKPSKPSSDVTSKSAEPAPEAAPSDKTDLKPAKPAEKPASAPAQSVDSAKREKPAAETLQTDSSDAVKAEPSDAPVQRAAANVELEETPEEIRSELQSAITLDEPSPDSVPTPTAEPVAVKRPNRKDSDSQAPAKNVSVAAAAIPQPVPAVARPETANLSGVDSTPVAPAVNETKNKPVESQPKQKAQADTEKTPVKPAPSPSEIAQASAKPASKKPETKKPAPLAGSASKSASANKKALTAVDANGAPNPFEGFDVLGAVERAHAAEAAAAQKKQAKKQNPASEAKKPAQNGASKGTSALSKGKKNRKRRH